MRFIALTLMLCVAACASARPLMPITMKLDAPPVGQVNTQELGDTLVTKGQVRTYDGLVVSGPVNVSSFTVEYIYPPQTYLARNEDDNWVYYAAADARIRDVVTGEIPYAPYSSGVARSKKNPSDLRQYFKAGLALSPVEMPPFEARKVEVAVEDSFRQELIYNGRAGSTVKFLYREIAGGSLRGGFSQDVQYDLSEGNIVGFKGARIEVLEATNARIQYRVLATFPD